MKHIVIIPDSVTSKRISAIELARRLDKAGYRITIVGNGGNYSRIDDFDYIRLDLKLRQPEEFHKHVLCRFGQPGTLLWKLLKWRERQAEVIKTTKTQSFYTALQELSPDLLLIDVEAHEFILAAIAQNIPVALFSVFFNLWKCPCGPPLHTSIIPGKGLRGHPLLIEWAWFRLRFWKWSSLNLRGRYFGMHHFSLLRCYAESLGLRLEDHVNCYQWLIPFLYRHLHVLVLNSKELEFPISSPANITYVGPMICTDRANMPFLPKREETLSEINEIIERYRKGRLGRRLVYCTFGSFFSGDDTAFLKKLVLAFKNTNWDVIIALGNRLKPHALGKLPENIYCVEFAPQMEILEVADCAVIHAGMTTVYECIHHGVPMVIYPFRVNDQLGTAARVVYHKLGIMGNRRKDRSSDICKRVEQVMADRVTRDNINRMSHNLCKDRKSNITASVNHFFEVHNDGSS